MITCKMFNVPFPRTAKTILQHALYMELLPSFKHDCNARNKITRNAIHLYRYDKLCS